MHLVYGQVEVFKNRIHSLTQQQIIGIILFVTLALPVMSMFHGGTRTGEEWVVDISLVAITWIYLPDHWNENSGTMGAMGGGFHILEPAVMLSTSLLCIFNILFAIQVVRFCKGDASKKSALLSGVLTLILPVLMAWQAYSWYLQEYIQQTENFVYVGPIPIQLIIGLLLIRFAGPWNVKGPWKDSESEQDKWWNKEEEAKSQI